MNWLTQILAIEAIMCYKLMIELHLLLVLLLLFFFHAIAVLLSGSKCSTGGGSVDFVCGGFHQTNLTLDGSARVDSGGVLQLTNNSRSQRAHAFYPFPITPKNSSFSSTFVFAIVPLDPEFTGHGITLFFSPSDEVRYGLPAQYLSLFNSTNNMNTSNHIFAVEFDVGYNTEFNDTDDNHVGVDVNGLDSVIQVPAAYFDTRGRRVPFRLNSGEPIQTWVEYDGCSKRLEVTVAPTSVAQPRRPLLSLVIDLSLVLLDRMHVGFSAGTGQLVASHYILGWSFKLGVDGHARPLTLSTLPHLPPIKHNKNTSKLNIAIWLPSSFLLLLLIAAAATSVIIRRKIQFAEVLEDWEREYGPHRFRYKDLLTATKGFRDKELLGVGGFGRVYRGTLPSSKVEVAVKRVSHDSMQGVKEFVAEIVSLGRLRHRNLVQLLGYCRRKRELILVYDYMPNGSLDKLLFDKNKTTLDWESRFRIIKGVASGVLYLHEEWEQIVVHRDIKASNVLIDSELNGRLGDFGLARLYDHGGDPRTTHVVGTLGYMAPELTMTSRPTTGNDVFAFGAFLLEVATGRRPIDPCGTSGEETVLVDWVVDCWKRGVVTQTADRRLAGDYVAEEMELVLKLGVVCSNRMAAARPNMREVVQLLEGMVPLQDVMRDCSESGGNTESGFSFSSDFGIVGTADSDPITE